MPLPNFSYQVFQIHARLKLLPIFDLEIPIAGIIDSGASKNLLCLPSRRLERVCCPF